jgi:apolipoprotein N-acyltransferase
MGKTATNKFAPYVPAIVSAALLVLSFPVFDLWFLAWVAFVPLLLSLGERTPKQSFATGYVFGLVYFFGTLYWIYHSINYYGGVSFVSSILIVLLLCGYLSLYPAVFAYLYRVMVERTKLPALFIAPVVWVVLEFLRSYAFTGFPWSSVGYSQYKFLSMIQVADITGIYGISFLVLSVNGALTDISLLKKRLREMPLFPLSPTIAGAVCLVVVLSFSVGYGTWRLNQVRPGKKVRISVAQGNIAQDKKWEPQFQNEVLNDYFNLSRKAAGSSPRLIVWPETAVPFFFGTDRQNTDKLIGVQKTLGPWLLFGSVTVKEKTADKIFLANSAILLDPEGQTRYTYDKIHLVPFGEYVPLRRALFFIDKIVAGIGDYAPGTRYERAQTPFGSFGTLVCYEVVFPGLVRKFYTNGGDFIVNITNDAWFGKTAGPYQHFSMAVFRAIENRKPLVRAANTGISGFIDSNGRIQLRTPLFVREVATADITMDESLTFYTKYGDLFSYACIVLFLIVAINIRVWRYEKW